MSNVLVRALLTMSIAGGAMALMLFALGPLVKKRLPKSTQYYLWLVVLAALLLPFSLFIRLPAARGETNIPVTVIHETVEKYAITTAEELDTNIAYEAYESQEFTPFHSPLSSVITLFFILYPVGALVFLTVNLSGYFRFSAKLKLSYSIASDVTCRLPVFRSRLAPTPMLIGLFRPAIVIPDREYTAAQLEHILMHELTHYRRRDVPVKWLSVLAGALHWFNPVVYFARRELDRMCELSCDEAVVKTLDSSGIKDYGDTLIAVVADNKIPVGVPSTTMCEEKRALKERLKAIMNIKKNTKRTAIISAILLITIAATSVLVGAAGQAAGKNTNVTARYRTYTIRIDGESIIFPAYNIDGRNYIRLSDAAFALSGSKKPFDVSWSRITNVITLKTGARYKAAESISAYSGIETVKNPKSATSKFLVNGKLTVIKAYSIGNNNYVNIRDIGKILDFGVFWDSIFDVDIANTSLPFNSDAGYPLRSGLNYYITVEHIRADGSSGIGKTIFSSDEDLSEEDVLKREKEDPIMEFVGYIDVKLLEFEKTSQPKEKSIPDVIGYGPKGSNSFINMSVDEYLAFIDDGSVDENIKDYVSEEKYQDYLDSFIAGPVGGVPLG